METIKVEVVVVLLTLGMATVLTAPASVLPISGECWTNGTHYGDTAYPQYATALPACWQAICRPETKDVVVATICTAGPDVEYTNDERMGLLTKHCYPSMRGELPGDKCCGGYPICAHDGENRANFNLHNFLHMLFDGGD